MYWIVIVFIAAIAVAASYNWGKERKARRRLEAALRALEARPESPEATFLTDEFVSILSHELRTPLTPILGAAYMLRCEPSNPSIFQKSLDLIEKNAKAQSRIVEDLLDVSRILSGKLRIGVESVNLQAVIEAAVETIRVDSDAKNIEMGMELRPLNGEVFGDSIRLQQVVWNLLANSVKFTPQGGRIEIELEEVESYAELRVRDTGVGIPADFLPYVFGQLRQADISRTRPNGGLGLGLSIVQQGSTFTIRLPLRPVAQQVRAVHAGH
jgi:two-component system, chemotaxis family, CheB/CheR fusion protein